MGERRQRQYGFWTRLLAPGLRNSQFAYHAVLRPCAEGRRRWLDVGCGHRLLPGWIHLDAREVEALRGGRTLVGIDPDAASLATNRDHDHRVRARVDRLPFRDATFDLVTANMVAEHLDDPRAALEEIARLLAPGGLFVFHTPNLGSPLVRLLSALPASWKRRLAALLEGRSEEDVFPTRYRLNREGTIRALAARTGLSVRRLDHVETTASTSALGPLVVPELLWIRLLRARPLRRLRTNLVVVLERPAGGGAPDQPDSRRRISSRKTASTRSADASQQ